MFKAIFNHKTENHCQDTIAGVFCDEAARAGTTGRECKLLPLVELACGQCEGLTLNPNKEIRFHAVNSWNSVGNMLAETPGAQSDEARVLEGRLAAAGRGTPAKAFFDVVLGDWPALANYTYTFRALSDIVEMSDGWPDDDASRAELGSCLRAIFGAGRE